MARPAPTARSEAVRLLTQLLRQQVNLTESLAETRLQDPRAQALTQALCYGVCRHYFRLEGILQQLTHKPFRNKDTDLKALALIGLYQLAFMRTPHHAAVSETVATTKVLGKPWAKGVLNGLLRNYLRQAPELERQMDEQPGTRWSFPDWLITRIRTDWPEQTESILQASNQHPPMSLRINPRRTSRKDYLLVLEQANIEATEIADTASGIQLLKPCPVLQLPHFAEGWVSVQDASAQLASEYLQLKPGLRVLDACAAPGGKTAHIAELQPDLAELVAVDVQEQRCEKIHQTLSRLHLQADVRCGDGRQPQHWHSGPLFDRILLDAPCSASGVIRRHPDIKLLRKEPDIQAIARIQHDLLDALWPLLAPGGLLLYTTCSIFKAENAGHIEAFLSRQPDAQAETLPPLLGHAVDAGRQCLPGENDRDGFFYAGLRKQ